MSEKVRLEDIDFGRIVNPGDRVIWTQGAGEPVSLVEKLLEQRHRIGNFSVFLGASYSGVVKEEHADVIRFEGMGGVGTNRRLCSGGLMDVVPCHLSQLPHLMAGGPLKFDVVIVQVSKNPSGGYGTGAVNGYLQFAMANARIVVAEINECAPRTLSSTQFCDADFHYAVNVRRPLVQQQLKVPGEADIRIAEQAARFIGDGDTLQIGIGAVPHALADVLMDRRDLGLHSGVIGDGIIKLFENGIITNRRKTYCSGRSIAGGLAGSQRLFDFADRNRDLWIEPVTVTHDPRNLAAIDNLVSINSAIEVDLTGQVGSEMIGYRYLGTIGGQNDFVRGALRSAGGRSIIALPSRSGKGHARIVPIISSGVVTVPRSDADIFVTEQGSAEVRGRPLSQRIEAMISIAHPDDRPTLKREAKRLYGY